MSEAPAMSELLMPPLPRALAFGTIQRWHVREGQRVAPGDVLAEVATASATIEIEAEREGRIGRILIPAGTAGIKVNTPIALLVTEGDTEAAAMARAGEAQTAAQAFGSDALAPGLSPPAVQTYREALRDALAAAMRSADSIVVLGTDLAQNRGAQKVTQGLLDEFGERRVVLVPPLDDAVFHLALGAALRGVRPVVEVTSWPRAIGAAQAVLKAAGEMSFLTGGAVRVPLVLRGANGFVSGSTGQDARCTAAELAQIDGLIIAAPATPAAASALLAAALRADGPVAILEHELLYETSGPVGGEAEREITIGRARVARAGQDATLVTYGHALLASLEAAALLERDGASIEVIDLMTLAPLDHETVLASARRTGRLMTVEEGRGAFGIGAEVIATVTEQAFGVLKAPPVRVAAAPGPMPYAETWQDNSLPNARIIREVMHSLLKTR